MQNKTLSCNVLFALISSCLFATTSFSQTPVLQNASFSDFVAASDSFPYWSADKDATGGQKFTITQETTGAYSAPGCLKIAITAGADTSTTCRILGNITGLTPGKVVTVTAMVKYADMPTYWNSMFNLQQATLTSGTWVWTNRKWKSMWGNDPGTTDWKQVTMSDTVADSANVFQLIISLRQSGTLWVDDIVVASSDASVSQKAVQTARQGSLVKNRIIFPSAVPYAVEAFGMNGKAVLKSTGAASFIDFNRLSLNNGVYAIQVKSGEKMWTGRVLIGK